MPKKILYLTIIIFSLFLLNLFVLTNKTYNIFSVQKIFAEDDEKDEEDEHKEEEEKEDEHDDDEEYENITETIIENVVVPENIIGDPITTTVNIIEPGYDIDSDGDKLVDALDPDPLTPQWEYYTDDDGDTVPNAKDIHKGEDDFKYFDFKDENNNGIIDFIENN